jgi:hypothetical protein
MNIFNWLKGKVRLRVPKIPASRIHTPTQKAEDEYNEMVWRESVQRRIRKTQAEKDRQRMLNS